MRVALKTKNKGVKVATYPCRKCDQPIKAGEQYYEWKHRHAPPSRQHQTHGGPRQSELCTGKMSGVYAAIAAAEDAMGEAHKTNDASGLTEILNTCAQEVEQVKDEYQQGLDNMPESLQSSSSGDAIQEKIDGLEQFQDALESAASECEDWDMDTESPEPGADHTDECASNEEVEPEEGKEATGEYQPCDCGFDDLETKKDEWESEQENKISEAFDTAENALQELSI